jgi:transcriptional regulator with XRE-family HTH domain
MANHSQDSRDGKGRYIRTPETAERDARAAELRAQGWTLQQIADELGYSDRSTARQAVQRALREIVQGPAEKLIQQEAARLDSLYEEALDILHRDHVMVSHGHIVKGEDGNPLPDHGPKLAAIDRLVKVRESYRRLFGLDARQKIDVAGGVRYEIVGLADDATDA